MNDWYQGSGLLDIELGSGQVRAGLFAGWSCAGEVVHDPEAAGAPGAADGCAGALHSLVFGGHIGEGQDLIVALCWEPFFGSVEFGC